MRLISALENALKMQRVERECCICVGEAAYITPAKGEI
jgi:hypothetical protein